MPSNFFDNYNKVGSVKEFLELQGTKSPDLKQEFLSHVKCIDKISEASMQAFKNMKVFPNFGAKV